jgi:Metallo-peptidase family M12B Reprolysin-like/Secretion system C-terminal sorting domain
MKKIIISFVALVFTNTFKAQNTKGEIWTPVKESNISITGKRQIIPQKYLTFNADVNALKAKLFSAPNERKTIINLSPCIVTLPLPDGTVQRFRVVDSPIMAEELAAAYPNIKTLSVKGIDDPYANGKLDWNEFGFHGMILTPSGDYFIDPFCVGNTSDYISYYTTDFVKEASQIIPEVGVILSEEDGKKKPAANEHQKVGGKPSVAPAICVGANLRTYRAAVACTGEYAVAATGLTAPTVAQTLAKIVTSINRVDGVYEKELSVRLVLVATETLVVYTVAASDPFTGNNNATTLIGQSQTVISGSIGAANYDIGHTFSTGGGGLANLGCVCNTSNKAKGITGSTSPVGDPYDIDYVAHEMGHQFGGNHTFNAGTGSCSGNRNAGTSVEPGSGITIMAYAGICGSIDNLGGNSIPYFHGISYDEIVNFTTNNGTGGSCAVTTTTGNQPPVVNASNYVVPVSTPFSITGSATDPNGDVLTYSWEETDPGLSTSSWNTGARPYFMSYAPSASPTRFLPKSAVVATGNYTLTRGEYLPSTPQTLNFRLTARDNKMGGGGVCYSNITLTIDNSGPLKVTNPNTTGIVWTGATNQSITWDVNNTDQAPLSCDTVRVLISYNNGNAYSVLLNSTPNDGVEMITVPSVTATINTCRIRIEAKNMTTNFFDIGDNNFTIQYNNNLVGVSEISKNNPVGLSVWPNPVNSNLNFAVANLNSNNETNLEVLDVLGKVVLKNNYIGKSNLKGSIDMINVASGVYFIKVSNNNYQSVYRVVKE